MPKDGLMMFLDNYDRFWSARVDGVSAPVQRADFTFKSIALSAGEHQVEWSYNPWVWRHHRHERASRGMVTQDVGPNSGSSQTGDNPGIAISERQVPNSTRRVVADAENIPADAEINRQGGTRTPRNGTTGIGRECACTPAWSRSRSAALVKIQITHHRVTESTEKTKIKSFNGVLGVLCGKTLLNWNRLSYLLGGSLALPLFGLRP